MAWPKIVGVTECVQIWYRENTQISKFSRKEIAWFGGGLGTKAWGLTVPVEEPISKELLKHLAIRLHGQVYKYWICWTWRGAQRVRRYSIPADPKSPGQLICRSKFAEAVLAGQALSAVDRIYWGKIGVRKREPLPWWNTFISAYMKDLVNLATNRHIRNLQVR